MTPNTFSVHFIVRNDRMDRNGYAPIYAKVTINGERMHLALNHKIKPTDWLSSQGQARNTSKVNKDINNAIEAFKSRIYQARSQLLSTYKPLTTASLKIELFGEKITAKLPTLIETATEHNLHFQSMIGIKYSSGSYKNYRTTLKYLTEFVPLYSGKKDIPLSEINYKFAEAYFTFVTTQKTCKQNGANKHIQRLKKILNYAIRQGYLQQSQMANYSLEFKPVNKLALTLTELKTLQDLKLQRKVLQDVRDVFLLQCYTGLSYGDVKRLSRLDIHLTSKNEYWIKMNREKTKTAFSVPLLPNALSILEKHLIAEKKGRLLPVLSNQKMNENLKVIQELAGISKNLTSHLARHTFATTITLGNGVPIETVSRMLGHTKLSTTQLYAKVLDNKIADDMDKLRIKLENRVAGI